MDGFGGGTVDFGGGAVEFGGGIGGFRGVEAVECVGETRSGDESEEMG